jgi:predicted RNA-binding Zn ribbon-like protein
MVTLVDGHIHAEAQPQAEPKAATADDGNARHVAPGELEVVRQFLNTHDVEEGSDEIAAPEALHAWLAGQGLDPGGHVGPADVERAVAMRESLRALTLANNGEPLEPEAIPTLNSIAGRARLLVHFDQQGETVLEPAEQGAEGALGELLAIVFRSMTEGTWSRLKACRDDTCQWAFYDRSRNRSATWCSMAVCGNRAKARSYRARHRSDS